MSGRWAWVVPAVTYLTVSVICLITAAVSYEHEYQLAYGNGQVWWVSAALPFTVDGMILAASVVLLWAGSHGIRRPLRPVCVLLAGIAATIAANLAAGIGDGWLGATVSAWSGFALIATSDVAMWMAAAVRRLAAAPPVRQCPHGLPVTASAPERIVAAFLHTRDCEDREPSYREVGRQFGVHHATVGKFVRAHLEAEAPQSPAVAAEALPPQPPPQPAAAALNGSATHG
jgi:hypothetical protein